MIHEIYWHIVYNYRHCLQFIIETRSDSFKHQCDSACFRSFSARVNSHFSHCCRFPHFANFSVAFIGPIPIRFLAPHWLTALPTMKKQKTWNIVWEQDRWWMSPFTQWSLIWGVKKAGFTPFLRGPWRHQWARAIWPKLAFTTWGSVTRFSASAVVAHWLTGKSGIPPGQNTANISLSAFSSWGTMLAIYLSRGLQRRRAAAGYVQVPASTWGHLRKGWGVLLVSTTL